MYYLSLQTNTKPNLECIFTYASLHTTVLHSGTSVRFKCYFLTCIQTEKPRHYGQPYYTTVSKLHFPLRLLEAVAEVRHMCLWPPKQILWFKSDL